MPVLALNKKAHFDYELQDTFEAGLVLTGPEVKSVKSGGISLNASYVTINNQGEAFLTNATVAPYKFSRRDENYNPTRSRKLLLHQRELDYLKGKLVQSGLTLVPLSVYTKGTRIKLEFALAKGKKKFDKRESIKKREEKRHLERLLKHKF